MNDGNETDWTRQERDRLDGLPRHRTPPPSLKRRIADELRARGRLRPRTAVEGSRRAPVRHRVVLAAAAIVLFLTGTWVGRITVPESPPVGLTLVTAPALAPAERVQRLGTRYAEVVAELAAASDSLRPPSRAQGREVALSTLRGAAEQVARIGGHDPRTERILHELRAAGLP